MFPVTAQLFGAEIFLFCSHRHAFTLSDVTRGDSRPNVPLESDTGGSHDIQVIPFCWPNDQLSNFSDPKALPSTAFMPRLSGGGRENEEGERCVLLAGGTCFHPK